MNTPIREPFTLRLPRARSLTMQASPLVMGILNITPDSFSDGGVHFQTSKAVHAALQMEEDGAAVIDIGGESTRPGAEAVATEEEIRRVVPVIEQIRRRSAVPISIDTRNAEVARHALQAGADIINDVSGLRDPEMTALAAASEAPVILMHMRGDPRTMQELAQYHDVVKEVGEELGAMRERALRGGVQASRILIDPGIGFAKGYDHNVEILARCGELSTIAPLVIGASRKSFIGRLTDRPAGPQRMAGSLACVAAAMRGGACMVRVHDVPETMDFLSVIRAIAGKERA